MTEAEWLACADPTLMLDHLVWRLKRHHTAVSHRKQVFFCTACIRRVWHLVPDEQLRGLIDLAEQVADELVPRSALIAAERAVYSSRYTRRLDRPAASAESALIAAVGTTWQYSGDVCGQTMRLVQDAVGETASGEYAALLHDIFGNPFRPLITDPSWLAWNDGTIRKMSQLIYDERAFVRLPLLADALEDAGCDNGDILAHCRGGGEHARGCWVVDLLLGKQ